MAELTVDVVYSNALYSVAENIGKKNEKIGRAHV